MAEMEGPLHFKGKIGDLRYYYNRFVKKWIVAGNGGANRNLIMNNPKFVHTRECMSEFSACSKWSSQLRKCLLDIDHLNAGYYMGNVVKLAKIIQRKDIPGIPGRRSIFSSRYKSLLTRLDFNSEHPFSQVLSYCPELTSGPEAEWVTLKIPGFTSYYELNWPKPFEWYRIVLVISQLSDYIWNEAYMMYLPQYPLLEDRSMTARSEWMKRSRNSVDIALTASFREEALPPHDVSVPVAVGVELASYMSGNSFSAAPGNGTMAIVACL